ncbi:UDP-N-acetylglucosamine 1-carboxyvinyltransferase [Candidatus Azambacteria bacterium]|nr:UDP-N-acetylglucosamine 1-carboxyvinyltransferase [Candidatus Azambacteria bacterium]
MSKFIINGGKKLQGTYYVSGAKNAAPKLLIASLLTKQPCVFNNIPRISDTFRSIDALTALGAKVRFLNKSSVEISCDSLFSHEIIKEAMNARQAVLFIGALLARFGKVRISSPRGDAIGHRPLNRHLDGILALGGKINPLADEENGIYEITLPRRPRSTVYRFSKNTHCGTENMILASVFNKGTVTLENAAEEPEVDNLIETLNDMGAKIKRTAFRVIVISGVEPFLQGAQATSIPDRLEIATAIIASILTGGKIKVAQAPKKLVLPFIKFLEEIGVKLSWRGNLCSVQSFSLPLKTTTVTTDWEPGFMTDWQPLATLILAVFSKGKSMIHERIYETRWKFLGELEKMGLRYQTFQPTGFTQKDYNFNDDDYQDNEPHAAYVWGPSKLKPAEVQAHDVRGGIDLILAALTINGKVIINDPQNHIDRGYDDLVLKLKKLGADITRL